MLQKNVHELINKKFGKGNCFKMVVDIIIIVFLIIAIAIGRHNGMLVSLINIFALIVALMIAFLLCKPIGNIIIEKTNIDDGIKNIVSERMPMNNTKISVENTNLPSVMKDHIQNVADNVNETKDNIIDDTSTELSTEIVYVLIFIIIFILVKILLFILKVISRFITKLPILKQIDHFGGAVLGLIEGVFVVYAIFAIISVLSPAIKSTEIIDQINDSYIGKQIYNNNLLLKKLYKS